MASVSKTILMNKVSTATENGDASTLQSKSKGFVGFIKLTGRTAGNYTGKIQHSPNNSDWTDVVEFAELTDNGSEVKQITTNILPFIRAVNTIASGPGDGTVLIELWYDGDK